jgi:hypothetical protein
MAAAFREVIDLTENEVTLPLHDDDGCIFSQELELPALPPLGKITTPDSEVDGLLKTPSSDQLYRLLSKTNQW